MSTKWQNKSDADAGSYMWGCCGDRDGRFGAAFWGSTLMIFGILLLFSNFGILPFIWKAFWPVFLISLGVANLVRTNHMRA